MTRIDTEILSVDLVEPEAELRHTRTNDSIRIVSARLAKLQSHVQNDHYEMNRQILTLQELSGQSQRRLQERFDTVNFLPEIHMVLIRTSDIVGSYEEAWDRLRGVYGERSLPRSVNLISGPSRTADIEQTIVMGAHGPRRLLVLILG